MTGFVVIHRAAVDHPLFHEDPSRLGAWVWMISRACWKQTRHNIRGAIVTLERGQFCMSVRQLAEEWKWSKSAVDRFLSRLETETMIERKAGHGRLIITICNYGKYQDVGDGDRDSSGTLTGTAAGQQRDIKEQGNKETSKPEKDNTPLPPIPDWMPIDAWNGFIEMRIGAKKKPTARAIKLLIAKLDGWRSKGHDLEAILNASTVAQWTDVYEPKGGSNGTANWKSGGGRDGRSSLARVIDEGLDLLG